MRSPRWAPPALPVPRSFERLDSALDAWFDANLRGRGGVDTAMYAASAAGDHGVVWLVLALLQARRRRPGWRRRLVRASAGLAAESALVNGPVKWLFRRSRPVHDGERPLYLRQPRTSSFPSGHASAAFFGAALLRGGDQVWPAYYVLAAVIAASRVHVRIHHASDVLGGALIGGLLGELVRSLAPCVPESSASRRR